jgi:pSer/pThr/pTyr-binding forkhead associated (FHA) protein
VGRGVSDDIALSDPRASRRHSQITRQGGQYILVDLGSSNGTLVNNRRIQGSYVLKEGDVITLGETEMVFHF